MPVCVCGSFVMIKWRCEACGVYAPKESFTHISLGTGL